MNIENDMNAVYENLTEDQHSFFEDLQKMDPKEGFKAQIYNELKDVIMTEDMMALREIFLHYDLKSEDEYSVYDDIAPIKLEEGSSERIACDFIGNISFWGGFFYEELGFSEKEEAIFVCDLLRDLPGCENLI